MIFLDAETFEDRGSEATPAIRGISCSAVDADESNDYFLRTSTFSPRARSRSAIR